jgi:acetyltransferase-like isoleucine patch superfamily enzyme
MKILRKFNSVLTILASKLRVASFYIFKILFNKNIEIQTGLIIGKQGYLRATDGGQIKIGKRVSVGNNVRIEAKGGHIDIGDDVFIGDGCIFVSQANIKIGSSCQIAEYVVIRDQDHSFSTRPIKDAGFKTESIEIGEDVWIGAKATITKGSTIGNGSVIGAHALVRGSIQDFSLAVGIPAKVQKQIS